MKDLIESMKKGDRRALSRLLSYVEDRNGRAFDVLEKIWPLTGKAYSVGITGPAGAGKSTVIDQLITILRSKGKKVGVIAVDPSSPFTGGAVLGDRVRMQRHYNDPDVFIRSVGTRGKSGGISFATRALIHLMDAFGTDVILIETVGAGQSEVDIADLADTTVVVLVPEAGDSIQALKAGILEIANVFVVNKKDLPGTDRVATHLEAMLSMAPVGGRFRPPIVLTDGLSGEGVGDLWKAIESHQNDLKTRGLTAEELERRRLHELIEIVEERLSGEISTVCHKDKTLMKTLQADARPNIYALAETFLSKFRAKPNV